MDALNFLKFWKHAASSSDPHLAVETDNGSDEEEDSFFDLELTVHDFDDKENNNINNNSNPEDRTIGESKLAKRAEDTEVEVTEKPVSANEPISKRKILPIEPISKPQSPIALLKSAPSFRISMFKKPKEMTKAESDLGSTLTQKQQKKETKFFALKLDFQEPHYSPSLSRNSSSRSHGSKHRVSGESKSERFSKEVLQKYLKLIKPLYMKISRRYSDKIKFSGDLSSTSPSSSPSVASVSSWRKEKQGNVPSGIKVVCKHLGKSRSASAATTASGVVSPARRSDDTLLQQHDGIQSAILHCKRSFNSREYSSTVTQSAEKSTNTVRKSFQEENGTNI